MRLLHTVVGVVLAAPLISCGAAPGGAPDAPHGPSPRDAREVSCGGEAGWPPSVMSEGLSGSLSDAEAAAVFASILEDPAWGPEAELTILRHGSDVEWRVLRDDGRRLWVGLGHWTERGPADREASLLALERAGDTWRATGWGDCRLEPVLERGRTWVEVVSAGTEPGSRLLTVQVRERECTSGRNPEEFLDEPEVVETSASVIVSWTSRPAEGDQDCPGNPAVARTLVLTRPLGDRSLLDGSVYPARRIRSSPSLGTSGSPE